MLLLIQTHCKHISRLHYEEGGTLPRAIGSAVPMSRDQDYARAKAWPYASAAILSQLQRGTASQTNKISC